VNVSPPLTATGEARLALVPSPSWPERLSPQQYARPPGASLHVWNTPEASRVDVISIVLLSAGLEVAGARVRSRQPDATTIDSATDAKSRDGFIGTPTKVGRRRCPPAASQRTP
jgi:hypothetical protein